MGDTRQLEFLRGAPGSSDEPWARYVGSLNPVASAKNPPFGKIHDQCQLGCPLGCPLGLF